MEIEAVLTVPGRVYALGKDDSPGMGVWFSEAAPHTLYVNGHKIGWMIGRIGLEVEEVYECGRAKPVQHIVYETIIPCVLSYFPAECYPDSRLVALKHPGGGSPYRGSR